MSDTKDEADRLFELRGVMEQEEYFFICPCCGADISVVLDLSVDEQETMEDCEVCCRPIRISYKSSEGGVSDFSAEKAN